MAHAARLCSTPCLPLCPPRPAAVAQQQRSQFLLHAAAALQACRLEKQRSRTRDRALLQLEQLAESMGKAVAGLPAEARMRWVCRAATGVRAGLT